MNIYPGFMLDLVSPVLAEGRGKMIVARHLLEGPTRSGDPGIGNSFGKTNGAPFTSDPGLGR